MLYMSRCRWRLADVPLRGASSSVRLLGVAVAPVVLLAGGLACYSKTAGNLWPADAQGHGVVDEQGQLDVQFFPLEPCTVDSLQNLDWG